MQERIIPTITSSDFLALTSLAADLVGISLVEKALEDQGYFLQLLPETSMLIAYSDYVRFIEKASRISGQPLLGSMLGRNLPFASLGLYGRYVMSAMTLPQALRRAASTLEYHESASKLTCKIDENDVFIKFRPPTPKRLSWNIFAPAIQR